MVLIKILPAAVVFVCMAWFVAFSFNPYKVCEDDPKDSKMYVCQPFDFSLPKGNWMERKIDDRFSGETVRSVHNKPKTPVKTFNCQDDNTLLTADGYDYCVNGKKK